MKVRYTISEDVNVEHVIADLGKNPDPTDDDILEAVWSFLSYAGMGPDTEIENEESVVREIRRAQAEAGKGGG
jgi:hypothetical protein